MKFNYNNIPTNNTKFIDQTGVYERIARLNSRSVKNKSKEDGLKLALGMIDLTTLEGKDTNFKVKQLCYKAQHPHDNIKGLPQVAAVCVYPSFVNLAKKELKDTNIKVASVATAFPSGMAKLDSRLDEISYAIDQGADEIDMVISRGKFLSGDYDSIYEEIIKAKKICNDVHLKVILETGELITLDNIRHASEIAINAGADFIKTSTGKIQPASTQSVTLVMLEAIRDHYISTGKKIGMKPAGGISDTKTAIKYLVMVKEILGKKWLTSEYFRFGASSLANDLLMQIVTQISGCYQSKNYFSND